MKTKIILQRHGQGVGNACKVYLGHTYLPLTNNGENMLDRVTLAHRPIQFSRTGTGAHAQRVAVTSHLPKDITYLA